MLSKYCTFTINNIISFALHFGSSVTLKKDILISELIKDIKDIGFVCQPLKYKEIKKICQIPSYTRCSCLCLGV